MRGSVPTFSGELDSASTCLSPPGFSGFRRDVLFFVRMVLRIIMA